MPNDTKIPLVIVEPHHHALEHIHQVLRRKARKRSLEATKEKRWTMVHFDSHPDLACPNDRIPASLCFTPRQAKTFSCEDTCSDKNDDGSQGKNLYELLDTSQSGIAEWILPLVFAGGLSKVYWLKNDWCDQFQNDSYTISVGAWIPRKVNSSSERHSVESFLDLPETASVKTSLSHSYYLDDSSVVPENELLLKQEFQLIVADLRDSITHKDSIGISSEEKMNSFNEKKSCEDGGNDYSMWMLDICLDYFICSNPFIEELETIDKSICQKLKRVVTDVHFRKMALMQSSILNDDNARHYSEMLKEFHSLIFTFVHNFGLYKNTANNDFHNHRFLEEKQYNNLYKLYKPPSLGKSCWDELTSALVAWSLKNKPQEVTTLCKSIVNAIPSITLPHENHLQEDELSSDLSPLLQRKVNLFGEDLRQYLDVRYPPSLITIARSSDDGFIPKVIVDNLQRAVLNEVHFVFCNCKEKSSSAQKDGQCRDCAINVVLDYGEYEGSTLD